MPSINDINSLTFDVMNEDLRVALILATTYEGYDSQWDELQVQANVQAIVRVPDMTDLTGADWDLDEVADLPDEDLTDAQLVARMIDYHWGQG